MKGLLLFVAGLVCGGAVVAWLFLGRDDIPVPVGTDDTTLPAPSLGPDGATGLGATVAAPEIPPPSRDPHDAPGLAVDPVERVEIPDPGVATRDEDLLGDGRIADAGPGLEKPAEKAAIEPTPADTPSAPDAAPQATTPPAADVLAALRSTTLLLPVQGVTVAELSDTYADARSEGRSHDAIDIMAPTGRPVRAVADGKIAKLFASVPGGLTVYQFDRDERLAYYYAHLDRYAADLAEGATVKRGDVIGYVGSTGNASEDAPHLHFSIFVLGPEKRWWQGTPVNPYPVLKRADTEVAGAP